MRKSPERVKLLSLPIVNEKIYTFCPRILKLDNNKFAFYFIFIAIFWELKCSDLLCAEPEQDWSCKEKEPSRVKMAATNTEMIRSLFAAAHTIRADSYCEILHKRSYLMA